MRVLLSTIGSRGDVQPIVATGLALKAMGHDVRVCVPPDFREWLEGLGFQVTTIGPELRATAKAAPMSTPITPEQRRQMIEGTVAAQFETVARAAAGCDLMVGATALQVAAPSIAEHLGIPYVFVAYCPAVLPSPHHAPPVLGALGDVPAASLTDYSEHWARDAERWNAMWQGPVNRHRDALGLSPVTDVRTYIHTARPWLAADDVLAPWPDPTDDRVVQTGAWILHDGRPLDADVESFIEAGDPPVYLGFGSIGAPADLVRVMVSTARSLGRRVFVSRGWAELAPPDLTAECLSIGEVNHHALFPRVAAVMHHGGAGTTTAAALAGTPQIVLPQHYDQHYFAQQVQRLGIGVALRGGPPDAETLGPALEVVLSPDTKARAQSIASRIRSDGASAAAQRMAGLRLA